MAGHRFRQRRLLAAAMAVGLYVVSNGTLVTPVAASAALLPECEFECGPSADCNTGCRVQIGEFLDEITCGEYNGGADNNQCNTCDFECNIWSAPTQECWMGGSETDCQTDGPEYAVCGDDICQNGSGGEGCDSCAVDCGECPDIVCGDFVCDPGETYVTCPEDCDDPGETGFCGDGICSEDDEETWENCFKDCVMPNERCEDDFDCGAGYTCVPGGEPYGGQCLFYSVIYLLESCLETGPETGPDPGLCDTGYVCREIGEGGFWCVWAWDLF